ncbi:MAG: carboxylesterase/lipase family protein [Chloroflexi bacterium]|nr:carboxylesterase/lipase family protein [Chloroflexota bacterium]
MSQTFNTIVNTTSGKLQGQHEDGLYVFRGIPYAAPPTGKRRWLPPQPLEPWRGVREAKSFGDIAPQSNSPFGAFREPAAPEPQGEDCLFLNIWSPGLDDRRRPVMVWIHGGAFSRGSGSSSRHPADTLARRGNAVLVTINYRLGPLGFLRLKEATNGLIPATGNEGLLDQIAALRWVNDNIAAFGGDPANITVFGESAGAMSVGCLLAMPQARGLFQKAILQSGASTFRPRDPAVRIGERFLEGLGIEAKNASILMSLTTEMLIQAQLPPLTPTRAAASSNRGATFKPVVDGETLPEIPLDAIQRGSAKDVIVLTGSNLEEAKLFGATSPALKNLDEDGLVKRVQRQLPLDYGKPLIEQYRNIRKKRGLDASPAEILMAIQTDQQFRIPDVRLAETQRRLDVKAYSYLFDWKAATPGLGACHALDVGFVFNCLDAGFHGSGPAAERLVGFMQDAWLAFARTGDPSCESLGEWPLYGDTRETMILGEDCRVEAAPYEEERRIWDSVPNIHLG